MSDTKSIRVPVSFRPSELRVSVIDDSAMNRSLIMEVLRGVGIANDHVRFDDETSYFQTGMKAFIADVLLYVHDNGSPVDFQMIRKMRRMQHARIAELPVIFLSAQATLSTIEGARDNGVDEFLARPVSPNMLRTKLRKVIEEPQPFVNSPNYIGPCRRRKSDRSYEGPRRRMADFNESAERSISPTLDANELVAAVTELRAACGELSNERMGLVARVRETATRTMKLARDTEDRPLFQTAKAVKHYLDGVTSPTQIEPHVLETGINALTQLSVLPRSYDSARGSVADLMDYAVRKKLAHYSNRNLAPDPELESLMERINAPRDITLPLQRKAKKAAN